MMDSILALDIPYIPYFSIPTSSAINCQFLSHISWDTNPCTHPSVLVTVTSYGPGAWDRGSTFLEVSWIPDQEHVKPHLLKDYQHKFLVCPDWPPKVYINKYLQNQQHINPLLEHPWNLKIILLIPRQVQHHIIPCKRITGFKSVSHGYALNPHPRLTHMVGRVFKTHHLTLPPLPTSTTVLLPLLFCPNIRDIHPIERPYFLAQHKVEKNIPLVAV